MRAEYSWIAFGTHLTLLSTFAALLHIEAVERFLGIHPALGLKLILANLVPYAVSFVWARWTGPRSDRRVWLPLFMAHVNLFLIGCFVVAGSATHLSPLWALYFLYVGAMANAFGFQPYLLLLVVVAGIAPGYLSQGGAASHWISSVLFAFLGGWEYAWFGLMVRRTLTLERQTAALEHDRLLAEERARIAEESSVGIERELAHARVFADDLAHITRTDKVAMLSEKVLATQDRLRHAMSQLRQALWSLDSAPATLADLLSHIKRCFGDLCQAAGVDLVTSLPPACSEGHDVVLSPLLKHQICCIALEAVSAALDRHGVSEITVTAQHDARQLELSIVSDGDPAPDVPTLGSSLRLRAAQVSGTVALERQPAGGTAVRLRVAFISARPASAGSARRAREGRPWSRARRARGPRPR